MSNNELKYTTPSDVQHRLRRSFVKINGRAFYISETAQMNISGYFGTINTAPITFDVNKTDIDRNIPKIGYVLLPSSKPMLLVRSVRRSPIYSYSFDNSTFWNPESNSYNPIKTQDIDSILFAIDNPDRTNIVSDLVRSSFLSKDFAVVASKNPKFFFLFYRKNCLMIIDKRYNRIIYSPEEVSEPLLQKIFTYIPCIATYTKKTI